VIQLIVEVTTKPGKREDYLKEFHANLVEVHKEPGCLEYAAFVDSDAYGRAQTPFGPDTIVILEKWATAEDLTAHSKAPHILQYQGRIKDLVESRRIHFLNPR
jgi:quinol monooxygenase YgiN